MKLNITKEKDGIYPRVCAEIIAPEYKGENYEIKFSLKFSEKSYVLIGIFSGKTEEGEKVRLTLTPPTHYFDLYNPNVEYSFILKIKEETIEEIRPVSDFFPRKDLKWIMESE